MADTDIAQRAAFDRIRYAQVWEDADILVEAIAPKPGDTVVSIASAGDNAFALLAEGCERVIAVDLNPTQLACVRLRKAMYRHLTHQEFLELMGSRPSMRRDNLLTKAAQHVSAEDQAFWASQREIVVAHGLGGAGKFERYFRIFRGYVLPFIHTDQTIDNLLKPKSPEERLAFYDRYWNIWGWRWMLKGFFSRTVMGRLGRDPAFFDHVEGSPADQVARLTRKALVEQDPSANPYQHCLLNATQGEALPRALQPDRYETILSRLDRLDVRLCTVETLAEEGIKADGFNLSDIFEYMSPEAHTTAYGTILSASKPGARIAYWNMMAPRRAPGDHAARVQANAEAEARLKPLDKAFFYSDFVVEVVK
jgi:S-adenosylmethionine-diacylglycerol 3-amino-3-carboxypropyl transferase